MERAWIRRSLILLFWILVWQLAAGMIDNSIIFAGPVQVVQALTLQVGESGFWTTIAASFGRICMGFLGAFFCGILLGWAAWHLPLLGEILEPFMLLIRSVPVASFVILALIWIGSDYLSVLLQFSGGSPYDLCQHQSRPSGSGPGTPGNGPDIPCLPALADPHDLSSGINSIS